MMPAALSVNHQTLQHVLRQTSTRPNLYFLLGNAKSYTYNNTATVIELLNDPDFKFLDSEVQLNAIINGCVVVGIATA